MTSELDAIRQCLRSFADAQVAEFYPLWNRINQRLGRIVTPVQFHIHRSDVGRDAAYVVLAVDVPRADGAQITWSVRLNASPEQLEVVGGVEVTDDEGSHELFSRKAIATTADQAAKLITTFSAEVCSQDEYAELPTSGAA